MQKNKLLQKLPAMSRQKKSDKSDKSDKNAEHSSDKKSNIGKIPEVAEILESYLSDNSSFSSSTAVKMTMDKIAELNNINEIFLVPIREKVLDFDGAKNWAFFLATCFKKYMMEDLKVSSYNFDVNEAFTIIEKVYDLAMEDYLSHIYDEEEENHDDE